MERVIETKPPHPGGFLLAEPFGGCCNKLQPGFWLPNGKTPIVPYQKRKRKEGLLQPQKTKAPKLVLEEYPKHPQIPQNPIRVLSWLQPRFLPCKFYPICPMPSAGRGQETRLQLDGEAIQPKTRKSPCTAKAQGLLLQISLLRWDPCTVLCRSWPVRNPSGPPWWGR